MGYFLTTEELEVLGEKRESHLASVYPYRLKEVLKIAPFWTLLLILFFWFSGKESWAIALAVMGLPLLFLTLGLYLKFRFFQNKENPFDQSHFALLMGFESLATFFLIVLAIYFSAVGMSVLPILERNIQALLAVGLIIILAAFAIAPTLVRKQAQPPDAYPVKSRWKTWQILLLFLVIYFGLDLFSNADLPIPQGEILFSFFVIGLVFMFVINLYRDLQIILYWTRSQ